ncbi:MAG: pyrroloquinoline quinone biosynthesis protein PqqB [Rhodanobacter denitrificans]|uniref:Coenzyme PQQ synthesis protein B n=1 Tax=Rhodanobacter denitrificans TaxID=666685 RepID=A0A2W5MLU5_9GAMM|nr:MAG: pyrroloquinoline quinone biosynthesis protein PqqB [Rhodanobacter denitrificans]
MRLRILGSAAGGGFPQWNCNCRNCDGVRTGRIRASARTQSSIAVRGDGADWLLINASPDLLAQIRANPPLQPARMPRDTGIAAVLLTDGQVDHVTGLAMLREHRRPLPVWCTDAVAEDLGRGYPLFGLLGHYCGVERRPVPLDGRAFSIPGVDGLSFTAVPVASKAAPYSPHREAPEPGDNIAVLIEDASGHTVFYAPGLAAIDDAVWSAMRRADVVLVDGTFWHDEEMIALGFSRKRARDIGHLPQSGPDGMIAWLDRLPEATRRVLIHINNTNPILDEDSAERAELARHAIEVAEDGQELAG